jgi:hypothetical protein
MNAAAEQALGTAESATALARTWIDAIELERTRHICAASLSWEPEALRSEHRRAAAALHSQIRECKNLASEILTPMWNSFFRLRDSE